MKLIGEIELNNKLNKVKHLKGKELNYVIEKNLIKLKVGIDVLVKQEKDMADLTKDFNEEVKQAQIAAATVGGELKIKKVVEGGFSQEVYDISEESLVIFNKKVIELRETHKDAIEKQKKEVEEYNEMLINKDSDFLITKVKFNCIPDDISTEDMKLIYDIIQEKES